MSGKLPVVSGDRVISALVKLGYEVVAQKGSHVKLVRRLPEGKHVIVVPRHRELDRGTLRAILRMFAKHGDPSRLLRLL